MSASNRVGRRFPLMCPHCEKPVLATVKSEAVGGGETAPPYLLELVQCGTCHDPFLMVEEDYGQGWDGDPGVLWPAQKRPLSIHVPEALRREHEEALKCFKIKAYTATAVMVRRTLEGVCSDQGVSRKPLVKMLEQLKDEGKLDGRLLEWAQELRVLGNDGAHFTGSRCWPLSSPLSKLGEPKPRPTLRPQPRPGAVPNRSECWVSGPCLMPWSNGCLAEASRAPFRSFSFMTASWP
ncbi:DUF4145 domain-containing protein [Streptomyces sp. NPDC056367]|uniref:DUF4145 domain-containing protein n=1 Tax=Streptomyces sp. NPDC056367 TaxID=3345797 RepID=UPI0035DFB449